MKKYKKILITTLAASLLMTTTNFSLAYAATETNTKENATSDETKDTTGPIIDMNSFKIDKNHAKPGDTVTISLKAHTTSKLKHGFLKYSSPNRNINAKSKLVYLDETGKDEYTGTFQIDEYMDNGTWTCNALSVRDENDKYTTLKSDKYNLSAFDFSVNNINQDITPPIVDFDSIKISKKNINWGDKVNISLKAGDDKSGIDTIKVFFKKQNPADYKDVTLDYNPETKLYEASFVAYDDLKPGIWALDSIWCKDYARNVEFYNICDYTNNDLTLNVSPKTPSDAK